MFLFKYMFGSLAFISWKQSFLKKASANYSFGFTLAPEMESNDKKTDALITVSHYYINMHFSDTLR